MPEKFILIPAYNPDVKLLDLLSNLKKLTTISILVVDDGSKNECKYIFQRIQSESQAEVLTHCVNQGKGRALKTGINHLLNTNPELKIVVTADADGQHTPTDILNICNSSERFPSQIILGVREFSKDIPFRSWFGNKITSIVFQLLIGTKLRDTQTGLRGYPKSFLNQAMKTKGETYEYEMNILIESKMSGTKLAQIPIQTVYIEGNKSSHFNPFLDSMRIYFLFIRFIFSSVASFVVDVSLFSLCTMAFNLSLLSSAIIARAVASIFNLTINQNFVFKKQKSSIVYVIKYYALVVVILSLSYLFTNLILENTSIPVVPAKIIAEACLFLLSFAIQRDLIFKAPTEITQPDHD